MSEPGASPEKPATSELGQVSLSTNDTHTSMLHALAPEWTAHTEVSVNVRQHLIIVTADKAHLCLQRNIHRMGQSRDWWTPAGIALSMTLALVTATFNNFILPAATWQALSVLILVLSLIWLVYALWHRPRCPTIEEVVQELREETKKNSTQIP